MSSKLYLFFLVFLLLVCVLLACEVKDLRIETDMLALLPTTNELPLKEKAFKRVSKEAAQKVIILISGTSQEEAFQAAILFYSKIKNRFSPQNISFEIKNKDKDEFLSFYKNYRYILLSDEYRELLKNENGAKIQEKALRGLYSPMSINVSEFIKDDPFLLSQNFLLNNSFFQSTLLPYKNVLIAEYDDKYYAFATLTLLPEEVFSPQALSKTINILHAAQGETNKQFKASEFIISGIPLHSYYASKQSIKEISWISWISTIGIVLLMLLAFASLQPLLFSLASILIGFVVAFAFTHKLFGGIHILTLVFGSSLSGVAVDYACHYFAEYYHQSGDSKKTINYIFPGIMMGLLTTILGYAAFFFTPFRGLQEIAFFTLVGITASFGCVLLLFPRFYRSKAVSSGLWIHRFARGFIEFLQQKLSLKYVLGALFCLFLISLIGFLKLKSNDDIRFLFSPNKQLLALEKKTKEILGYQNATQFFLITAKSEQKLLEKEEKLTSKLNKLIAENKLSSYQAFSHILPSLQRQKENYNLIQNELMSPHFSSLSRELGFSGTEKEKVLQDFKVASNDQITPKDFLKSQIAKSYESLYLGKIGNVYGSIVLLDNLSSLKPFKLLNQPAQGIHFMDKVGEVSEILGRYRHISFIFLVVVYSLIFPLLLWRYGLKKAFLIMLCPISAGFFTLSIMGFVGHSINLFDVLAMFLVLGMGIDYAIFYAEAKEQKDGTALAVLLSCVSTLLSFGLLAFSSFNMISSFGLTTFLGILFSYVLSPLVVLLDKPPTRLGEKQQD